MLTLPPLHHAFNDMDAAAVKGRQLVQELSREQPDTKRALDLIQSGADVNAADKNRSTALVLCALGGHDQIARALLSAGARTDIVDRFGGDAATYAKMEGHTQIEADIRAARAKPAAPKPSPG